MYEELANYFLLKKFEIASEAATNILNEKLEPYSKLSQESLTELMLPTVEMVARYFQNGDIAEWQAYIAKLGETRHKNGFDVEQLNRANWIMNEVMQQKVRELVPAPEDVARRNRYLRRIASVGSLAHVGLVHTSIKKEQV